MSSMQSGADDRLLRGGLPASAPARPRGLNSLNVGRCRRARAWFSKWRFESHPQQEELPSPECQDHLQR